MSLDFEDRHAAFRAGVEYGLATRYALDTREASHETQHTTLRPMIRAIVADLNARGGGDHQALQERRRQHQLEAWQAVQAAAKPWPPETAPQPGPWPPMRYLPFQTGPPT